MVIGYLRVSTQTQAESGAGINAQRSAILAEAVRRDWQVRFIEDAASGKSTRRPGLEEARALLAAGLCDALVVAKLDRLSRSVIGFRSADAGIAKRGMGTDCPRYSRGYFKRGR